jgi:hypothetical protein
MIAGSRESRRVAQRSRRVEIAKMCHYDNWKGGMARIDRRGGSDRAQSSGGTPDSGNNKGGRKMQKVHWGQGVIYPVGTWWVYGGF